MILSHLADELTGCPLTKAGFLYWVFTPPGADTWVYGIHHDPDPAVGYRPDLVRSGDSGATWAEDSGGWPADYIITTPSVSSNTNAWLSHNNFATGDLEYWRRTAGGWSRILHVTDFTTTISSHSVHTVGPGAGDTWAVYTTGVTGFGVQLGTWDGSSLSFTNYAGAPSNGTSNAFVRGTAGNLWLVILQNKGTGGDRTNTWIRQLAGSTPHPNYTDATPDNVDSTCNELYVCPDGSLWGAGWQWADGAGTARHAALWRHDGSTGWVVSLPPLPATEATSRFYGIHGTSASDVWAVGYWTDTSNTTRVLLEHWDGSNWYILTPVPDYHNAAGGIDPYLVAVQMRSSTEGWAVGAACDRWLSYHFTGGAWMEAPLTGV